MTEVSPRERAEYAGAALVDYAQRHKATGGLRYPSQELIDLLRQEFGVRFSDSDITQAIEILSELGVGEEVKAGHGRPYFVIASRLFEQNEPFGWSGVNFTSSVDEAWPILAAFQKLGSRWLLENLRVAFQDQIRSEQERSDKVYQSLVGSSSASIPASDRTVSIDHNAPEVQEILLAVDQLSSQLQTANDTGSLNDLEVRAAAVEVEDIARHFRADVIRPTVTFERAKGTLNWIASKASEAVVGALALALLGLIASFLGFPI